MWIGTSLFGEEGENMLDLPRTTEFNRRIPKQKFYENLDITPALKRCFIDQIRTVVWRNKIAPDTVNLAAGQKVSELQVFSILLNDGKLDEAVLKQIDREIPYHILFLLEYDGRVQAWIGYKEEAGSGTAAFKVNQYYHTDWMTPEELPLKLEGLDMDSVYENLVRQIAGETLETQAATTLQEAYEKSVLRDKLVKQIATLEKKAWNEKQPKRKLEIAKQLQGYKRELDELGL